MESKVALVTGATQGLGRALVEGLVERMGAQATVYVTGRNAERALLAARELPSGSGRIHVEPLDVGKDGEVERVARLVAERHGGIDVVYSNAYHRVAPRDDPASVITRYVNVNNLGTTRMLRAFGPLIREGGSLVVVASTVGTLHYLAPTLHPRFDGLESLDAVDAAVCAWRDAVIDGSWFGEAWPAFINIPSKIGQVSAVRTLAQQRREGDLSRDILIAAACPGMVDTDASRPWFDMSSAQTPRQAAGPLLDMALDRRPRSGLYGELVRFGRALPWQGGPAPEGPRGRRLT